MSKPKVAVIGFDGATWRLLKPLVDGGYLPNLAELLDSSSEGELRSTIPPVTFPAWHSMFTGLNPGKIGVYGFAQVDVARRRYILNTIYSFRGDTIWRIASDAGYRVTVVNVPTARVEPVNGVIVGGPFNIGRLVHPSSYEQLLNDIGYEAYPEELSKSLMHRGVKPSIETIKHAISSRFRLTQMLMEREKPDLLIMTIFVIDNIQHFYWGDEIVQKSWIHIDEELGKLLKLLKETNIFIVSDHGFIEAKYTVSTIKALEPYGLVKLKRKKPLASQIGLEKLIPIASKLGIGRIARKWGWLYEKLAGLASAAQTGEWVGAKALEVMIDWDRSAVIPIDNLIYINPNACKDRMQCTEDVVRILQDVKLIDKVYRKDEVYRGPYTDLAPDIIVIGKPGVDVIAAPGLEDAVVEGSLRPGWRAIHEATGVIAASGPDINTGMELKANIVDVAPTVLALLGIPPEKDMDGRVLTELLARAPQEGMEAKMNVRRRLRERLRRRIKEIKDVNGVKDVED